MNRKHFNLRHLCNKEISMYLLFGILTTIINITVYFICKKLAFSTISATTIAYICSIIFAFITNRNLVFSSNATNIGEILKEATRFFSVRTSTYIIDAVLMLIFVDKLNLNSFICKISVTMFVIVLNFLMSNHLG